MNIKMVLEFDMTNGDKAVSFDKERFNQYISELELNDYVKEFNSYERTNKSGDGNVYVSEISFRDVHIHSDVGCVMVCCMFFKESHDIIRDDIKCTTYLMDDGEPCVYFVKYNEVNDPISNGKYEDRVNRCKEALSSIDMVDINTVTIHTSFLDNEIMDKAKNLGTTDGYILNKYAAKLEDVSAILMSRSLLDVYKFMHKCLLMCNLDNGIREGSRSVRVVYMYTQDEYRKNFNISKTNVGSNKATLH